MGMINQFNLYIDKQQQPHQIKYKLVMEEVQIIDIQIKIQLRLI